MFEVLKSVSILVCISSFLQNKITDEAISGKTHDTEILSRKLFQYQKQENNCCSETPKTQTIDLIISTQK